MGQPAGSVGTIGGLGGTAWGAAPLPVAPIGTSASGAGLPPAPPQIGSMPAAPGPAAPKHKVPEPVAQTAQNSAAPASAVASPTEGGPYVAKCQGLPFSATTEKVERFFSPLVRSCTTKYSMSVASPTTTPLHNVCPACRVGNPL